MNSAEHTSSCLSPLTFLKNEVFGFNFTTHYVTLFHYVSNIRRAPEASDRTAHTGQDALHHVEAERAPRDRVEDATLPGRKVQPVGE